MSIKLLLDKLSCIEQNFTIGCCHLAELSASKPETLFSDPIIVENTKLDPSFLLDCMSSPKDKLSVINEYSNSLVRTLIKETIEAIADHAKEFGHYSKIRANDTFNFARVIKNAFAHGSVISYAPFYKKELSKRSITWKDKSLTLAMENLRLDNKFFNYSDAIALFNDLRDLCKDKMR